jgi:hypothetical protein
MHFRNIQPFYRPNPRPRTSSCCRCTSLRKISGLLSTHKIKLLSILKDRQWSPCDFVETSLHCRQVLSLQFPVRTPPTSLQVLSRKEFDVNWEEVSTVHDWVNWRSSTGSLPRLLTKDNILHLFLQIVSQDSTQELIYRNQNLPYLGLSRSAFHVRRRRIWLPGQSVVCVRTWKFLVCSGDFLERFSWSHFIYLFVYIICLSGTWWVFMFEFYQLSYSL